MHVLSVRGLCAAWLAFCVLSLSLSTANAQQRQPRSDDGARDRDRGQPAPPPPQSSGLRNPGGDPQGRLRPPQEQRPWRLGAEVDVLDVGVRVRSIEPRSAAERAGLERGDVIITVEGYQVGQVGNRVYLLEDELQRLADPAGRVRLLVQDQRNRRLTNLDVRLQRGRPEDQDTVRGLAIMPEGGRVPQGAEIRVRLMRRAFFGDKAVAEMTRRVPDSGPANAPVEFDVKFDPRQVDLNAEHYLEVEVRYEGRVLYEHANRERVQLDPPGFVEVKLRRV